MAEILGRAGFADFDADAARLSGGWRKRLAIVEALVQAPDILLLDEPTNHLDLAGIQWLEGVLQNGAFACVVVSHDRYFLENVANEVVELNPAYEDGALRVSGNYSTFLEKKEEYLHAQRKRQEALENRVHTEIEWLRRGPKARTTKSKARIDKAHEMIGDLAEMNANAHEDDERGDRFLRVGSQDEAADHAGWRELCDWRSHAVRESAFHRDVGNARRAGRAERKRKDDAAAPAARRHQANSRQDAASRHTCASCTSIRIANSIPT